MVPLVKEEVLDEIVFIWAGSGLPVCGRKSMESKLKNLSK